VQYWYHVVVVVAVNSIAKQEIGWGLLLQERSTTQAYYAWLEKKNT
jgi:hypothetical protein